VLKLAKAGRLVLALPALILAGVCKVFLLGWFGLFYRHRSPVWHESASSLQLQELKVRLARKESRGARSKFDKLIN